MAAPNMGLQPLQLDKVAVSNGVVFFSLPAHSYWSRLDLSSEGRHSSQVVHQDILDTGAFLETKKNLIEYKYWVQIL